jgi:hypothetical protein
MVLSLPRLFACLGSLFAATSIVISSPISPNGPTASNEWILSTTKINTTTFQNEPYVANGYIGARLPVEGFGLRIHQAVDYSKENGTQGWPLFTLRQTSSVVAGFYDQQDETKGTNFVSTLSLVIISSCLRAMLFG